MQDNQGKKIPKLKGGMQVYVKFIQNGKTLQFDCDLEQQFEKLKRKIKERCPDIPYDMLLVTFDNQPLMVDKTLKEQNITKEAKLEVYNLRNFIFKLTQQIQDSKLKLDQQQQEIQIKIQQASVISQNNNSEVYQLLETEQKKVKQLNQQIISLNQSKENIQNDYENTIKQLKEQVRQLQITLDTKDQGNNQNIQLLYKQLESEQQYYQKQVEEIKNLKRQLSDSKDYVEKLQEEIKEMKFEQEFKNKEVKQLTQRLQYTQERQTQVQKKEPETQSLDVSRVNEYKELENQNQIQQFQIKEQQEKLAKQKTEISQVNKVIQDKDRDIEQLRRQLGDEIQKGQIRVENFEDQKKLFDAKNRRLEEELQNKEKIIKNLKEQLEQTKDQNLITSQQMKKIQDDLEKQIQEITSFKEQEKKLQQKLEQEEQHKEKVKDEKDTLILENKRQIQILNGEKQRLQLQYEQLMTEKMQQEKTIEMYKNELQQIQNQFDESQKAWSKYEEKVTLEKIAYIQKKKKLTKAIQSLKKKKNLSDQVISPTQAFCEGPDNLENVFENLNIQSDSASYKVSQILSNVEKIEQILQQSCDFDQNDLLSLKGFGQWQCKRTVQPVSEGDNQQMFFFQVESSDDNSFVGQVYAFKKTKDAESFTSPEQALKECLSHFICQTLLSKFFSLVKKHSKEKISEFKMENMYLLEREIDGINQYFICERFVNGEFKKYNGGGLSYYLGLEAQIANAYSYFTYHFTQKQLLVSHIQGINNIIYDPIISTEDGLLNDQDLGIDEISQFITKVKESDPKQMGRKFLALLNIKVT